MGFTYLHIETHLPLSLLPLFRFSYFSGKALSFL
jgi:hypothetical protein